MVRRKDNKHRQEGHGKGSPAKRNGHAKKSKVARAPFLRSSERKAEERPYEFSPTDYVQGKKKKKKKKATPWYHA